MKAVCHLSQLLKEHFPSDFARIMLIVQMVIALIRVRTVSLSEIATGFAGKTKTSSNERLIPILFENYILLSPFDKGGGGGISACMRLKSPPAPL